MLSFATEFPISPPVSALDFIRIVREWIGGSPHTPFTADELAEMPPVGGWALKGASEHIESIGVADDGHQACSVRRTNIDGDIEWVTEITYSGNSSSAWIGVRTARESNHPASQLPPAKKPIVVSLLLGTLGGGYDGDLVVQGHAHRLQNDDIDLATRLIDGDAGCRLPVVYVSCGFRGDYLIDYDALASDLAGMAHVVSEPNRSFSNRLQINVRSENVYGGVIGIYWPESAARRSFFLPRDFLNSTYMKRGIIDEVRNALLNRRPIPGVTWLAVQGEQSRQVYENLKSSGSVEIDAYTAAFDSELRFKDQKLEEAEREIARLSRNFRQSDSRLVPGSGVTLATGNEKDFFNGELRDFVYDALEDALRRLEVGSRRHDIIHTILKLNPTTGELAKLRDRLKEALRNYTSMDKSTKDVLDDMGFIMSEEGKHIKLIYRDDGRYTFTLPKTGSDHRGGLNSASQIGKKVF